LDIAVSKEIVRKSGAWYTYEGEQIGQGRENVKRFLTENPDLIMEIQDRVLREVGLLGEDETAAESAPSAAAGGSKGGGKTSKGAKGGKGAKSAGKSADELPISLA